MAAILHCVMQEDGPPSCVKLNGRKPSSDEEIFLQRLYDYMEEKQTPIGRIPTLGFQKGNKTTGDISVGSAECYICSIEQL